jgi:hypothetical protein
VHAAHERKIRVGKEKRHQLAFLHADAVLAGQAAANLHAIADDFGGDFHGALKLRGVSRIEQHDGMQIAVAGVKNITDEAAVFLTELLNVTKRLRKLASRNDAVKNIVARSDTAEGTERVFAALRLRGAVLRRSRWEIRRECIPPRRGVSSRPSFHRPRE